MWGNDNDVFVKVVGEVTFDLPTQKTVEKRVKEFQLKYHS